MRLDRMIQQSFESHQDQPLFFVVPSFDHLFMWTGTLERWMREGRLDHAAAGQPSVPPEDVESFFHACSTSLAR